MTAQTATLNTHSRYLHDTVLDYADRLLATFDPALSTVVLTCTASEANDVALRMAQLTTGNRGVIVSDRNYHGNTSAVMELSTLVAHQGAQPDHVRTFPVPDTYWPGEGEGTMDDVARRALAELDVAIASLDRSGHGVACAMVCPVLTNEGFPRLPEGFMVELAERVRRAGGIVIADEVQSGFGRVGTMWGHDIAGIRPEIITLGKSMGNGYPVAAVVTEADIMHGFRSRNYYFNTYGSNPVAAAAALATLEVLEDEDLVANAATVGEYLLAGLRSLAESHDCIGEVRGHGLYVGCEIITTGDGDRRPDPELAERVIGGLLAEGVIVGLIGIHRNLLKVRPPLPLSTEHADHLLQALGRVLEAR